MKLTHNIKSQNKPYKNLGVHLRGYETPQRELNTSLTPTKFNQNNIEPLLYSARSTNIKLCPYENNLVYSQVNDRINQFSNRPYKENNIETAQRLSVTENYGSDRNQIMEIKKDIMNLKEIIQNSVSNISISRIKQEVMEEVNMAIEQHRNQTARSLRQAIIKVDESTKRECITQFSRQFLPLSYLDDSEQKFSAIQDKFMRLQKQMGHQKVTNVLNFNQQLKKLEQQIRKSQRQYQDIKYNIRELQTTIRSQSIALSQQKAESIPIDASWEKRISEICQAQMQKLSKLKMMKKDKDGFSLQETQKQRQLAVLELNALQNKRKTPQKVKIEQKTSIMGTKLQHNKSMSFTFSLDSLTDLASPQIMSALPESMSSIKDIKSSKYIIDNQNNLLDQSGKYILDDGGKQIRLTQQQILMLKDSNVVKYREQ